MVHPKLFSTLLLLSCFLLLSFTHGLKVEMIESLGHGSNVRISPSLKGIGGKSRKMMIEIMDYADPGPNTNTRSGYLNPPPPPSPAT
ncbi:hypothetical protein Csa_007886 [Cucumis sativus]|uniref:Transmembrane protein n=1 Tax=Cucumis sativus TaxID=3659 RepID=A0A0A0KSB7_CUCSA|nr:hypothetical protein Csa_007886 [Cucumis sativus]